MTAEVEMRIDDLIRHRQYAIDRLKELLTQRVELWNVPMKMKRADEIRMQVYLRDKCEAKLLYLTVAHVNLAELK